MQDRAKNMRITVSENGPYFVDGDVPLIDCEIVVDEAGDAIKWAESPRGESASGMALCRCGRSNTKPYCDGSHFDAPAFDGTEVADNDPYLESSACIHGPAVVLRDARRLCAEARFCAIKGGIWNLVQQAQDPETIAIVENAASMCPSGRYTVCDSEDGPQHEPEYEASIGLIEDPQYDAMGPLWVRGGIPIVSEATGAEYEVRNRVTLCRCGKSKNKPFCDGSHLPEE